MPISTPQFFLEFSLLLGGCYLLIRRLNLSPSEKASLFAGLPVLCFLLPALRIPGADVSLGWISWLNAGVGFKDADWAWFIRNARPADFLFGIYWIGFAVGLAQRMDRLYWSGWNWKGWSVNRFYRKLFSSEETGKKLLAAQQMLGAREDIPLSVRGRQLVQGRFHRAHFFEVLLLEAMVLINWWNPLMHLYRKGFAQATRTGLISFVHPSRRLDEAAYLSAHWAVARILSFFLLFVLLINVHLQLPGSNAMQAFLQKLEISSQQTLLEEGQLPEPETTLEWGGHKIPLAEVKSNSQLAYKVYHLMPFELYMLQNKTMQLSSAGQLQSLNNLIGQVALPHSDQLKWVGSKEDFSEQLMKWSTRSEQTFFLRLEAENGKSFVAVLAVSENAQVYQEEKGMRSVAHDVAGLEPLDALRPNSSAGYRLEWGDLRVPLERYASPDVYRGDAEAELEEIVQSLQKPIKIFLGDSILSIDHLTVRAYGDPSWRSVIWYTEIDDMEASLEEGMISEELASKLSPGDLITLYGRAENLYLNTITIKVSDPNELYRPLHYAPKFNSEPAEFRYQLFNRPGYTSIVRIDTLNPENQRVYGMYKDKEDYRVIHVPEFRTNERLVNCWEKETEFIEGQDYYSIDDLNYGLEYPEYHAHHDSLVRMKWGEMLAMVNSQSYDPDEYELNRRESIRLWIGDKEFRVEKVMAYYVHRDSYRGLYFLDENDLQVPHLLPKVKPETSVFFKRPIIIDETGQRFSLPVIFGFHIGKEVVPGEWIVDIKAAEDGVPRLEENKEEGSYTFDHYRLSELIPELMDVRPNRFVFQNMKEDPLLRVHFYGPQYRRNQAYGLILSKLMKQYGFSVQSERMDGQVARIQVNYEERLLANKFEGELPEASDRIQVFDPEGFHQLRGLTLTELTHLLEDRFGRIFEMYPTPYNSQHFNFSLILDNYPSVQQQLINDYGLQVFEGDWQYYVLEVAFAH